MAGADKQTICFVNCNMDQALLPSVRSSLVDFGPQYELIEQRFPEIRLNLAGHIALLVLGLGNREAREIRELLLLDRYQLELEKIRALKSSYSAPHLLGALAAIEAGSDARSYPVLVLADAPDEEIIEKDLPALLPLPSFSVMDARSIDRGLFDLLDHRERYGFTHDRQPPRIPWQDHSKNWGPLAFARAPEFFRRITQEFDDPEVEQAFLELCEEVFGGSMIPAPIRYQVALGALRMARRLVSFTLEGEPYQCSVYVGSHEQFEQGRHGCFTFIDLIEFEPSIPLDFNHLSIVRDQAELIQSDKLIMHVDTKDGCVRKVYVYKPTNRHDDSRLSALQRFPPGLVVHMRGGHFVEVYARGRTETGDLRLWYDGFRWKARPFRVLNDVLCRHFGADATVNRLEVFVGAVATLLDQGKSSIVVFLAADDREALEGLISSSRLVPLRDGIEFPQFPCPIHDLPAASLAGILQIDGAHIIDGDWMLKKMAQTFVADSNVQTSDGLNQGNVTRRSGAGGTGRLAARGLSHRLANSFVLKVSASGNLKFYHKGDLYGGA